jgi:hypothetical protein
MKRGGTFSSSTVCCDYFLNPPYVSHDENCFSSRAARGDELICMLLQVKVTFRGTHNRKCVLYLKYYSMDHDACVRRPHNLTHLSGRQRATRFSRQRKLLNLKSTLLYYYMASSETRGEGWILFFKVNLLLLGHSDIGGPKVRNCHIFANRKSRQSIFWFFYPKKNSTFFSFYYWVSRFTRRYSGLWSCASIFCSYI